MHGVVFQVDKGKDKKNPDNITVYASFGGLMMSVTGHMDHLSQLETDQGDTDKKIFAMLRKVDSMEEELDDD